MKPDFFKTSPSAQPSTSLQRRTPPPPPPLKDTSQGLSATQSEPLCFQRLGDFTRRWVLPTQLFAMPHPEFTSSRRKL
eukprot:7259310-Alexandrium_andersonii.AAC.1